MATRPTAPYTDVTVSWSKSISVLHVSIRENARQARLVGHEQAAAWWEERERRFSEVLQAANLAALRHLETWAGMTRTGSHAARIGGELETGRWEAAGLVVTSWLQGTSRDGDPHDQVHNLFARMVQTERDGKWRALDTMALRYQLPAAQAIAAAHVEAALTREFGVAWVPRSDGAGNEICGITQETMDAYSSRAIAVDDKLRDLEGRRSVRCRTALPAIGRRGRSVWPCPRLPGAVPPARPTASCRSSPGVPGRDSEAQPPQR